MTALRARGGPVLQLSMRRVHDRVACCALYEFEDVVGEVAAADRVEILDDRAAERARRAYRLARMLTGSKRLAAAITPRAGSPRSTREYELFFPLFNDPFELFALAAVTDWRSRCRRAACFIREVWPDDLPELVLEVLSRFDHVFLGTRSTVAEVARLVGKPCSYLPLAADVLRFAPAQPRASRTIHVCNLGPRSPATHEALLALARKNRLFYLYDTARAGGGGEQADTLRVGDVVEHRRLLAGIFRQTRYCIANRARAEDPAAAAWPEISARFYEGIAAGAVLLGDAPRSTEFRKQFDWSDAVVPLPFDSPDAGEVLLAVDADPLRVADIRAENVRQAALRHDWLHRLQRVFAITGVRDTEGMRERARRLEEVSRREEPDAERADAPRIVAAE